MLKLCRGFDDKYPESADQRLEYAMGWFDRLIGRGRGGTAVAEPAPMPSFSASEVPDFPEDRRFSVWDQLADDPGARALRAEWEARWDAF